MKRRNKINGQWSPRLVEMLCSPAYRALNLSEHRVLSRVEIELANHGGNRFLRRFFVVMRPPCFWRRRSPCS